MLENNYETRRQWLHLGTRFVDLKELELFKNIKSLEESFMFLWGFEAFSPGTNTKGLKFFCHMTATSQDFVKLVKKISKEGKTEVIS